jgi:hypothetical protein
LGFAYKFGRTSDKDASLHLDGETKKMKPFLIAFILSAISSAVSAVDAEPDRFRTRSDGYQHMLDGDAFQFSDERASTLYSLSQFGGYCELRMISEPRKRDEIEFQFFRDGKKLVEYPGSMQSVFCEDRDVLYFAHFVSWTSGCSVTTTDLKTGKKIWETELSAIGLQMHSLYSNRVTMSLYELNGVDQDGEGSVWVTGHEANGNYVEILDRRTGKCLAHRIYALQSKK